MQRRGCCSVYTTNYYEYFILALWFIHVQINDFLADGLFCSVSVWVFFFPTKLDWFYFHEVWGLAFCNSVSGAWIVFIRRSEGSSITSSILQRTHHFTAGFNYCKDTSHSLITLIQILLSVSSPAFEAVTSFLSALCSTGTASRSNE